MKRRQFKRDTTLDERLTEQARKDKERASKLPAGPERDRLLRQVRQIEITSHLTEWLTSPGLQPPKR
jgi:hypothetical protein